MHAVYRDTIQREKARRSMQNGLPGQQLVTLSRGEEGGGGGDTITWDKLSGGRIKLEGGSLR